MKNEGINIIDSLHWRYATKKFSDKKLSAEELDILLESIRLAPTSYGQQPFRVIIIQDPEMREKLIPASFGQDKVAKASHLLVFAVETGLNHENVAAYIDRTTDAWDTNRKELEGFENVVNNLYAGMNEEQKENWAARQAYLSLGFLMTTAAIKGIDVCPMEGIEPATYDELLGLKEHNLKTVVVATLGFRAADDALQHKDKSRKTKSEMFLYV